MEPRGIDGRDMTQPDDQPLWLPGNAPDAILEQLGGAEEERPGDLVDLDTRWNNAPAHRVGIVLEIIYRILEFVSQHADVRHLRHAPHEEEGGQHHADLD